VKSEAAALARHRPLAPSDLFLRPVVGGTAWVYCDRTIGIPIADALALSPLPNFVPASRASSARQKGKRRDAIEKAERDRREVLRHRSRESVTLFGGLLMRTNPHSRHGKCGRLRFAGILDARAKADDARQVEEMRRKMGLPAGFRSVQTLSATDEGIDWAPDEDLAIGGSTREEGLEDCDPNDDDDDHDDAYDRDIYDFDTAALDLDYEVDPGAG
jgi:hypothetical protein